MAKVSIDLDALDDQEFINEDALLTDEDFKRPTSSDLGNLHLRGLMKIYASIWG